MEVNFIWSLAEVTAGNWNEITGTDYPFLRYEFLNAMEKSGVTVADTGWQPQHVLVWDYGQLIAVMPLYIKSHSYGEYVFDFSWADAYQRNNFDYYPKLVSAIPYTPVTGPRLCVRPGYSDIEIFHTVLNALVKRAVELSASSWHLLFPERTVSDQLAHACSQRKAVHFQWHNQNYQSFDDFLATFNSRKRKNLRKERQRVLNHGITLEQRAGADISKELWQQFYFFYQMTYARRSGHGGYLNQEFFEMVATSMPEQIVMMMASQNGKYIAGALNFCSSETLYGRYWGCIKDIEYLHFETCYYQGIEYCINNGLQYFDPGVQGEHKVSRGFRPVYTYSNHWIADKRFRRAIDGFLQQEAKAIAEYKAAMDGYLPFKSI